MELPQPPADQELKNIIDKLAQFVARNGPEFEQMTKTKQKGNPKFSFLFGGDYFNYYQYKVTTEQAILKHRQAREQNPPTQSHPILQIPPQPQMPGFSGPPGNGYPNNFNQPYSYPPSSSGYDGNESNQFPPGVVASGYHQSHQFPLPPMQGGEPSMPLNSGPPTSGNTYGHPPMPPNSTFPPGDSNFSNSFNPPGGSSDVAFPPQHQGFAPPPQPGGIGDPGFQPQQSLLPPGSDQMSSSASGNYQPPPPPPPPSGPGPMTGAGAGPVPVPGPGPVGISQVAATIHPQGVQASLESIAQEQRQLQEQIKQSEQNLTAQQQVLDQQRELQIREGVYVARAELLLKEASDLGLNIQEFEDVLIPIMESCTKDSISNGKHWIFTHGVSPHNNCWISMYLLYKSTCITGPFTHKLHIIYLMNDVLHHCIRKNADNLKVNLEKVLSPMFCHAVSCASDDQRAKLDKLLSLWESKMHLDVSLLSQLRDPLDTWAAFEKGLLNDFPQVVATVNQHLNSTFEGYQQQHNAFVQHASNQLQQLEQQKMQLEQQQQQLQPPPPQQAPPAPPPPSQQPPVSGGGAFGPIPPQQPPQFGPTGNPPQGLEFNQPPPGFATGPPVTPLPVVDFSKPPPGFIAEEPKENLVPTVPYFELPAGLMVPLIRPEDNKYKPLDPASLRLPLPTPPSERLLGAVENFYQPPNHDRPRNCEGWEQLALYDYYKAKAMAVKNIEHLIQEGFRERSRSPSPVVIEVPPAEENLPVPLGGPIRRYRSVSPEMEEQQQRDLRPQAALTPDNRYVNFHQSRSASPLTSTRSPLLGLSRSPLRIPSRSRSRSRSRSLSRTRSNTRSRSRSKSRSKSRSPPPKRVPFRKSRSRSVTPPSFGGQPFTRDELSLDESNKGHQMLRSMGWSGTGLGAKEQGIAVPISAAEVRETPQEKFRGLGVASAHSDPYEAFRKNKGQAFINRMKARAEEKY